MRRFSSVLALLLFLNFFASVADAQNIGDVVSRVQTNLNRIAAGFQPAAPVHATNVDGLVDAFSAMLAGGPVEIARAMHLMDEIEIRTSVMLRRFSAAHPWPVKDLYARHHAIDAALALEPGMRGEDAPWIRFVAVSYKAIDALGKGTRHSSAKSLKIACAAAGRLRSLTIEAHELKRFIGELTDCPMRGRNKEAVIVARAEQLSTYLESARNRPGDSAIRDAALPLINPDTPDWARRHMGDHPEEAERILRQSHDVRSRIDYGLFLYYFRPASPERDESIRRALSAATEIVLSDTTESHRSRFDSTFVSRLNIDQLVNAVLGMRPPLDYAIPCAIVFRAPEILEQTEPRYGGGRDAFLPKSDCDLSYPEMTGYPLKAVKRYRRLARAAGKYGTEGSLWTAIYVERSAREYRVQSDPRAFLDKTPITNRPYETWSYLSIANRQAWREIDSAYSEAFGGLASFYRQLGLSEREAVQAAQNGLYAIVLGPDCGNAPPPESFRKLILDGASAEQFRVFGETGPWREAGRLAPFFDCAAYAGIEPLAHLAIRDLEGFRYLKELADTLAPGEKRALDLEMDVNAPNAFGKTPLMTALQHRLPEAVTWLMANGARIDAVTDSVTLQSGRRTPLMYAAASGSLEMIKTLLEAGADPLQADTMGHRALHYLLGAGPSSRPPNPALSEDEFHVAYGLLR